jgi:septal ring factor EnvC (AmiA/AmiB activator)
MYNLHNWKNNFPTTIGNLMRIVSFILLVILVSCGNKTKTKTVDKVVEKDNQEKIIELENQIVVLTETVTNLELQILESNQNITELEEQRDELQQTIVELNKQLEALKKAKEKAKWNNTNQKKSS